MAVSTADDASRQLHRNPGPAWGSAFLQNADRFLPGPVFRAALALGTWVGVACMPVQRRHSRDYLAVVLGHPPRWREIWRHFYAFSQFLILKLRVARGVPHLGQFAPGQGRDFEALMASGEQAFFGTFHFGQSDLLGYLLGHNFQRQVFMVRLKMGNATDTRLLGRLFGKWISFIWVDKPENLLFALKDAVASGGSLAMQCDRLEFTSKTEGFEFLGARREFPFTIYHLGLLFDRPVIFCVGLPSGRHDSMVLHASSAFRSDPRLNRAANLQRAREHFQGVLTQLESLVRQHPSLWFNFLPLNPVTPSRSLP
jgi:predicted LPLAT superfamily acyltransferase